MMLFWSTLCDPGRWSEGSSSIGFGLPDQERNRGWTSDILPGDVVSTAKVALCSSDYWSRNRAPARNGQKQTKHPAVDAEDAVKQPSLNTARATLAVQHQLPWLSQAPRSFEGDAATRHREN